VSHGMICASQIISTNVQVFASWLIVATGAVSDLVPSATTYLRVRAFAQPALLISIVTQSCLLAQKDSKSPAHSVLLQVVVNSAGDILLITQLGMGVVGAAWATVAAQYLGMLLLLKRLGNSSRVQFELHSSLAKRLRDLGNTLAPLVCVACAQSCVSD
jgi:Na+-driven multidrug efflux pump